MVKWRQGWWRGGQCRPRWSREEVVGASDGGWVRSSVNYYQRRSFGFYWRKEREEVVDRGVVERTGGGADDAW